jgi:hypothetical protein
MSAEPEDVCDKILKLSKDKIGLAVALSKLSKEEREKVNESLELVKKCARRNVKKRKIDDIPEEDIVVDRFIENLKKNIKENLSKSIITYVPSDMSLINEIESLKIDENKKDIVELHSRIVRNEVQATVFTLNEAYFRGKFYDELRKNKFDNNDNFLVYCEDNFKISITTVYTYINLYILIHEYPSLVLSGMGVSQLRNNRKKIRDTVKKDPELLELISTPFPGIKAIISINDVTSDSTIDERLSKVHVNDQNN